jgi:rubrerythrin
MAITGHACDGWVFWSVQPEENAPAPNAENQEAAPAAETEHKEEPAADTPKGDTKKTGVFLVPNQKGVPEGQIRWFCRDCGKSFITSAVEIPGVCPAKHQAK